MHSSFLHALMTGGTGAIFAIAAASAGYFVAQNAVSTCIPSVSMSPVKRKAKQAAALTDIPSDADYTMPPEPVVS